VRGGCAGAPRGPTCPTGTSVTIGPLVGNQSVTGRRASSAPPTCPTGRAGDRSARCRCRPKTVPTKDKTAKYCHTYHLALGAELSQGEDPTMRRGTAAAEPIPV
jgi:hypothetical protein